MKTTEQVRSEFNRLGRTISDWSRQHGFNRSLVYAVLEGRAKGNRGKSHTIAVLLGLKHGVADLSCVRKAGK